MGKHTQKEHPHICIPRGHPGCVWGLILHAVKYPDWHYVKKRLPHRKHGGNKRAAGEITLLTIYLKTFPFKCCNFLVL